VGAQIVSVPASLAEQKAQESVFTLFVSLFSVFLLLFVTTNVMLRQSTLKPLTKMSEITEQISLGNVNVEEFPETSRSEIGALERSINRLRRSLDAAMAKLDGEDEDQVPIRKPGLDMGETHSTDGFRIGHKRPEP